MAGYIVLVLFLSVLSSILMRAGGMDKQTKHWIPVWMRQSWVRDWLCPACVLIPVLIISPSWWILLAYIATGGALSTYWDKTFGFDNLYFSGFMVGVALFPLLFFGFNIVDIGSRACALAIIWGGLNLFVNKFKVKKSDFIEEYTRGATLVLTMLFIK